VIPRVLAADLAVPFCHRPVTIDEQHTGSVTLARPPSGLQYMLGARTPRRSGGGPMKKRPDAQRSLS